MTVHLRNALAVGPRLYLRPRDPDDSTAFTRFTAIDPDPVWDRLRMPVSELTFRHYSAKAFEDEWPSDLHYTICLKEGDQVIGDVGLHDIDWLHRNAETSAWVGDPDYRDRGYGTEAKFLLLEIAFDILHLHVLMSWVWEPNARSAAAVQKQGYRPAGHDPYDDMRGGMLRDAIIFDVLRDEYLVARTAWEQRIAALTTGDATATEADAIDVNDHAPGTGVDGQRP